MPHTCRVPQCKVVYGIPGCEKISFHQLPKNIEHSEKWKEIIKQKYNLELRASDRLCSNHFDPTYFSMGPFGQRRLKPNSVPTIFSSIPQKDNISEPVQEAIELQNLNPAAVYSEHIREPDETNVYSEQSDADTQMKETCEETDNDGKKKLLERDVKPQTRKRRYNQRYLTECNFDELDCSPKIRRLLEMGKKEILDQRRKIRSLQSRSSRLTKKLKTLKDLLKHLTKRNSISQEASNILEVSMPGCRKELLQKLFYKSKTKFPPALRCFATTLQFYSAKAYNYVRAVFCKSLPHPQTIRKWYQKIDASPGMSKESMLALENKAAEAKQNDSMVLCNMTMDEIMIKKKTECIAGKMWGLIDLGTGFDDDSLDEAGSVLTVMLVCINSNWKLPIAYYFINALRGDEKANLVNECLRVVHETGVKVTSLTFDGAGSNIAMCNILGAQTWISSPLRAFFPHPVSREPVYIFYDPSHNIKLIRGASDNRDLFDEQNNRISWRYIESLVKLQEDEGLHAATRLRRRHINWKREKMNVKLAVQTLSSSVGHALLFAEKDLKLTQFQGAEATARFCFMFDSAFDILNSRNKFCKTRSKAGMCPENINNVRQEVKKIVHYISTLKDSERLITESNRKTGFIGFIISLQNALNLYDKFVDLTSNTPIRYLLTYKLSQDHLEVFFSAIRSRGGFNNNPTCSQFAAAYKRLLVHAQVGGSERANAIAIDNTTILQVSSTASSISKIDEIIDNEEYIYNTENDEYFDHAWITASSEYMIQVLDYIAGFVVRTVLKNIKCYICPFLLTAEETNSKLMIRKTRGGLIMASPDVVAICCLSENLFRVLYRPQRNIFNTLACAIIQSVPHHLLETNHVYDQSPLNDHRFQLIKCIVQTYLRIRINHEEKGRQASVDRIRKLYSRMIVHKHQ